jgi:hypothetical protein
VRYPTQAHRIIDRRSTSIAPTQTEAVAILAVGVVGLIFPWPTLLRERSSSRLTHGRLVFALWRAGGSAYDDVQQVRPRHPHRRALT